MKKPASAAAPNGVRIQMGSAATPQPIKALLPGPVQSAGKGQYSRYRVPVLTADQREDDLQTLFAVG